MFKPIFWIFFGGGITIIGGAITLIATYKYNINSSARNERIEGGVKDANAKADNLLIENKGLHRELQNATSSLDVQGRQIRELGTKLDPFIELAKSKHPGKSDDEALQLLKSDLKKVGEEVKKTANMYKPQISGFNVVANNVPVTVYRDANKGGESNVTELGFEMLYRSAMEVKYATELKRTDVTFEVTTNDVVAGYVELLDGGALMYIRAAFNDNGNCAFHLYNPENSRYRFTIYTRRPIVSAKLNCFEDFVKQGEK